MASDFTTGVVVGTILADDSSSQQQEPREPDKTIQFTGDDQNPVVIETETFKAGKWRKLEGPEGGYFICPGEYRWNANDRCRVPDSGFNGFMGGYRDEKELPLVKALEQSAGKPVELKTIEHRGGNLFVRYQLKNEASETVSDSQKAAKFSATAAAMSEVSKHLEERANEGGQIAAAMVEGVADAAKSATEEPSASINNTYSPGFGSPFQSVADEMLEMMTGPLFKGLALLMLVFGVAQGVIRQNVSSLVMGVMPAILIFTAPTVFEAVLATPGQPSKPIEESDSGLGFGFIFVLAVPVIIMMGYKFLTSSRDEELDEILASARERIRDEREPPSVDELRERQERENNSEQPEPQPRVISQQNADAGIEITKNKRKIVID